MDTTQVWEFETIEKAKLAEMQREIAALKKQVADLTADRDSWRKVAKEYESRLQEENLL